jgi:plastocyanin
MRHQTAARVRRHSTPAVLAVAIGVIALAGCGSSKSSSSSTTTSTPASTATSTPSSTATSTPAPATSTPAPSTFSTRLSEAANPEGQLKFTTSSLTAKAGLVTINFTNSAPLAHNLGIESASHSVLGTTPTFQGGSKTVSVKLAAGTYKFFCSVPGHRAAGMEGTLTVQ